jgi:hypothetical protein
MGFNTVTVVAVTRVPASGAAPRAHLSTPPVFQLLMF